MFKIITLLFLFHCHFVFGIVYNNQESPKILTIPQHIALPIGVKIWFNESGGSIMGLTDWNDGEDFASLGIGHFVWHPYANKNRASLNSGFPSLIRYIEKHSNTEIPTWLRGNLYCPWNSRQEFLQAKDTPRMAELRIFLQKTIPIQAECLVKRLEEALPDLLASAPPEDRLFIYNNFHALASTPSGIYALVDFLNFKGAGISDSMHNYEVGSGLLHVLKGMKYAPRGSTLMQAYVWSAKNALLRRVQRSSPYAHHERWLAGWFNRINTYLEGEYLHKLNNG